MSVDSINLEAMNAYKQISSNKISRSVDTPVTDAVNFQKMMEVNFNKLASLTPDQILKRIPVAQGLQNSQAYKLDISSNLYKGINQLKTSLNQQEHHAKKASLGEANIIDLMTSTTQASNILSAFVAIKDSAKESWEKIWSMSL